MLPGECKEEVCSGSHHVNLPLKHHSNSSQQKVSRA